MACFGFVRAERLTCVPVFKTYGYYFISFDHKAKFKSCTVQFVQQTCRILNKKEKNNVGNLVEILM